MNPFILPTFCGIIVLLVITVSVYIFRLRERDHQRAVRDLNQMLDRRDEEYESVLDRLHATRNLPPTKVDLTNEFAERKEKRALIEAQRVNGGPIRQHTTGPVDSAVLAMELDVRRRQTEAASS